MHKVINGKRYDTSSAKEVARWWNGKPNNDFYYVLETLYRKKTGEFFLHGEGGAMSLYCSESIKPLTIAQAMAWTEKKMDGETYEKLFGELKEDENRKIVTYSLPAAVVEKIKKEAEEKRMTLSDVIASKF